LVVAPEAISPKIRIEQGATIMPIVLNELGAIAALTSFTA
jgi:hypothetical protein